MTRRPHERGDGRRDGGVAGQARSEPETLRSVVFPAHTCEADSGARHFDTKKIHPRSVINVFSTVRLVTVEWFRLQQRLHHGAAHFHG